MKNSQYSRRDFLRRSAAAAAGVGVASRAVDAFAERWFNGKATLVDPGRKMNIACVGIGGKGRSDVRGVSSENIVALCDVDSNQGKATVKKYPKAKRYTDFRKMLQDMGDKIDGITISTPDHMHFPVAMLAMQMGKHVFVQKPCAHTVWEARMMTEATKKYNVVTQMGNQGHAREGVRLAKEWVQAGLIGDVKEIHVWTPKLTNGRHRSELRGKLPAGEKVPDHLDWNLWIGTATMRDYSPEYVPYKWRGWLDFGCGALGDIGCHTMDAPFFALDLAAPSAVTAKTSGYNELTFPDWSIVTYEFPQRGKLPPVKMVWYDGGKQPERPPELGKDRQMSKCGYYMRGDRGVIYDASEKCTSPRIVPETKRRAMVDQMPQKTIPRIPRGDPHQEWVRACKGGPKPGSNLVDHAGPLSETVLLGCMAIRANGKRMEWDPKNMRIPNMPELNQFLRHKSRVY